MTEDKESVAPRVEETSATWDVPKVLDEETDDRTGWSVKVWEDGTVMVR